MKKDKEWLKRIITDIQTMPSVATIEYNAGMQDAFGYVQKLIDELDEPEKIVIPQIVADYLSEAEEWVEENKSTFLELVNGKPYEVEEEQKYYVLTSRNKNLLIKDNGEVRETYQVYNWVKKRDKEHYQLTEQEIKDYDERFWAFAAPVEMEEPK